MVQDFMYGVHKDQRQVHLGFGNEGLDVSPADFQKLMEAISNFDMEIVLHAINGLTPRAGVVAYGMGIQWDNSTQTIRMQIGGSARSLTADEWNQLMVSLRMLLGCVNRWQRGAVLPNELELPAGVAGDDAAAAVAEVERMLREIQQRH